MDLTDSNVKIAYSIHPTRMVEVAIQYKCLREMRWCEEIP